MRLVTPVFLLLWFVACLSSASSSLPGRLRLREATGTGGSQFVLSSITPGTISPAKTDGIATSLASGTYSAGTVGSPCSSTGTITYTWTWQGTDPAPPYAVVTVTSTAKWIGAGLQFPLFSGTVSDGLGDSPTSTSSGGISTGTHSFLATLTTSGGVTTATYSLSPSAQATGLSCNVSVQAAITPITMTLVGPVNGNLAVGQLMTATVNGMGGATDTYTWSQPSGGNPFANYVASAASAVRTELSIPPTTSASLSSYFGYPGAVTINCSYYCAAVGQTLNLNSTLTTVSPVLNQTATQIGMMEMLVTDPNTPGSYLQWSGAGAPEAFMLYGVSYMMMLAGLWQVGTVKDPPFLPSGSGTWGYVQLYTTTYNYTIGGVTAPPSITGPGYDGSYYEVNPLGTSYPTPADGTTIRGFSDKPGWQTLSSIINPNFTYENVGFEGDYSLYLFYTPVASAAGPSVVVPIRKIAWTAKGHFATPPWAAGVDDGSGPGSTFTPPLAFPTWGS